MSATEFSKQKTEEDYYERIRDLATKIDWKFVEHIWSINQPFIKMSSGSFKRRGHKKTAAACVEPGEPEIEEAKKCRGFKSVTFSMCDTKTELDKQVGNVENILFRCSGNLLL